MYIMSLGIWIFVLKYIIIIIGHDNYIVIIIIILFGVKSRHTLLLDNYKAFVYV